MAKTLRITRRASRSLLKIARWTVDTFGLDRARKYEAALIAQCDRLCRGTAHHVACHTVIDPALPEALRLSRYGRHFIGFRQTDAEVIVLDFLHRRQEGKIDPADV